MNDKTTAVEFDYVPVRDANMLMVKSGIDANFVLSNADNIDSAVRHLLDLSISYDELMTHDVLWLMKWAMDAAHAYRKAAGAVA